MTQLGAGGDLPPVKGKVPTQNGLHRRLGEILGEGKRRSTEAEKGERGSRPL